jgi:predicted metal-dependent hydrolase
LPIFGIFEPNGVQHVDYTLIRSNRKTCSLSVRENGTVEVRAPLHLPEKEIVRFVEEHATWIAERRAILQEHAAKADAFALHYGDTIDCAGVSFLIVARPGNFVGFTATEFYTPMHLNSKQIQDCCKQILRLKANTLLLERVTAFAKIMEVHPKAVKINGAQTHWGSCSAQGNLNFSWLLLLAESDLIDYVVVHELAHLKEMNHSARFWAVVEKQVPDYAQKQTRLQVLQAHLCDEGWK